MEKPSFKNRIASALWRGAQRRRTGADLRDDIDKGETGQSQKTSSQQAGDSGSTEFPVPADMLRRETLAAAIDALKLELKFILGDFPEEQEWISWLKGFGDHDERLIEIVKRRNPSAARFSDRFPSFWRDLRKQVGI